jgi:GAF domain-containing protein
MADIFSKPSLEDLRRAEAGVLRVRLITVFIASAVAFTLPPPHPEWTRWGAIGAWVLTHFIAAEINRRATNEKTIRWNARGVLIMDFAWLSAVIVAYAPAFPGTWVGLVIYTAIAAARERYAGAIMAGIAGTAVIFISFLANHIPLASTTASASASFQAAVLWLNVLNIGLLVREIDERNLALMQRGEELTKAALLEQAMLAESKMQEATLRKVVELTVTLMRERELGTLLDRILELTLKGFGFRAGSILVADRDREVYRYSAVRGYPPDAEVNLRQREVSFAQVGLKIDRRFAIRPSVFYAPYEQQSWFTDPMVVYDRGRLGEPRANPQEWNEADTLIFGLHSSSGDVIGLLVADAPEGNRIPSPATIDNVALFAHLAAAAIENVHLFTTEQRRSEELSETNREINRLYREAELAAEARSKQALRLASILDLTASIFKERDLDRMLARILEVTLSQFNFAAGTIVLSHPTRNVFVRRAAIGYSADVIGKEISYEEMQSSMTDRARVRDTYYYTPMEMHVATGVVRNPQRSKLPRGAPGEWHEDDLLLFPFFDSDAKLIGALSPDEPRDHLVPDEETARTIEVFAQLAGAAVEGARLREAAGAPVGQ